MGHPLKVRVLEAHMECQRTLLGEQFRTTHLRSKTAINQCLICIKVGNAMYCVKKLISVQSITQ